MIAKCQSEDDAKEVLRRLTAKLRQLRKIEREDVDKYPFDWGVEEARFYRDGRRVVFQVRSANAPGSIASTLQMPIANTLQMRAANVNVRKGQQALRISVKVPKGMSAKMAPLFLEGDEAKVLRLLLKVAGKPATMRRRDFDVWEWRVIGKFSYFEEFGELYYDGDICFKLGKDWNVQILGKRLK